MTAIAYQLNPNAARETDNGSQRITESGAYVGVMTAAKHIEANSGTIGIEFSFHSNEGAEAHYLTLYTRNREGSPIFGEKQLYALMTCLKLREIKPVAGKVEQYDFDARAVVKKQATLYQELMSAPIGVVLQSEEYQKNNGEIAKRMVLVRFFDAKTRQTASEILDKAPPVLLDKFLATLKDKTLSASVAHPTSVAPAQTHVDVDFDDDIPF